MFCRSLFILLYFFFWPLCCLFFLVIFNNKEDIRILMAPLPLVTLHKYEPCTDHHVILRIIWQNWQSYFWSQGDWKWNRGCSAPPFFYLRISYALTSLFILLHRIPLNSHLFRLSSVQSHCFHCWLLTNFKVAIYKFYNNTAPATFAC